MISILLSLVLLIATSSIDCNPLNFGFITTDNLTASELKPPLEIALSLINGNTELLPAGHKLEAIHWIGECDRTSSLNSFLDQVLTRCDGSNDESGLLGLVGTGCTDSDLPLIEIMHHWNIPLLVSYSAEKEVIEYLNYYQLFPLKNIGRGLQGLMTQFNWTRIAILSDNQTLYNQASNAINESMASSNVSHWTVNCDNLNNTLENATRSNRILFINTNQERAREILCYALNRNLSSPRYVWIMYMYGWFNNEWWKTEKESDQCSNSNIEKFLNKSRVLLVQPFSIVEEEIVGGINRSRFYEQYTRELLSNESDVQYALEAPAVFDSVWSLALAINSTLDNLGNISSNTCSQQFSSERFKLSGGIHFKGTTGDVSIVPNKLPRQKNITILQYREGIEVAIGFVSTGTTINVDNGTEILIFLEAENHSTLFPDLLPMDGTPIKEIVSYDTWLVAIIYMLATSGVVFSLACFLFTIINKEARVVKLTSPKINLFILLGCFFVYCSLFTSAVNTTNIHAFRILCYVNIWLVTLGISFAFGAIIAKLYRVVAIFKNVTGQKKKVQDWKLVIFVLCITGLSVVVSLIQVIVPQFRVDPVLDINQENPSGLNELSIVENYCVLDCISASKNPVSIYYQIIFYFYLLLILAVAFILAFQTRKIKIDVLNDYKWIAALVYAVTPSIILVFVVTLILTPYLHLGRALYCIGLFLGSTTVLSLVFIPKMVALAKDPRGEHIFDKQMPVGSLSATNTTSIDQKTEAKSI